MKLDGFLTIPCHKPEKIVTIYLLSSFSQLRAKINRLSPLPPIIP